MEPSQTKRINTPYIWTFTTYFTEGFPYTIIRQISSLFLRDLGLRLESIGLTSLFGLPWILKFLWSPHIDRFGTKRYWLLQMQGILIGVMLLAGLFAPLSWGPQAIGILFFIGSFFAATHDTAIDGFYMEALDTEGQAKFVGYRVMAYRIAMITGTGLIATIGTTTSWALAFFVAAIIFGLFFVYHTLFLPNPEQQRFSPKGMLGLFKNRIVLLGTTGLALLIVAIRLFYQSAFYKSLVAQTPILKKIWFSHWIAALLFLSLALLIVFRDLIKKAIAKNPDSFYSKAFFTFIDREKIGVILFVIIFMRTGEFMLSTMVAPFFVDLGIKVHYGWLSSAVGLPCSIGGAMLGGWMISRYSLRRVIWPFLLLQNLTNVLYMIVALYLNQFTQQNTGVSSPQSIGVENLLVIAGVHGFDQFAGGLGTAVLMTFLMRLCLKQFKAAHYAIGTGLMNISGVFVGVLGGFLCSWFGYGYYFGFSFLISLPGMVAIFFLPNFIYEKKSN